MNVKRGLIRVWVLLSVAWIGLVGLLAYQDSGTGFIEPRNIYFTRTFGDGTNQFERMSNHPLKAIGISYLHGVKSSEYTYSQDGTASTYETDPILADLAAKGHVYKVRLDEYPQFTLYIPTGTDAEERDRQIDRVAQSAAKIAELVTAQKRKNAFWNAAKAGVAVPLGLLVVGAGIYWAVAGFARAPKQSS